jgi:nucleoside-diphosphate-sugar epimerase
LGDALAGSDRPLVIASGVLGLASGRVATERDGHGSAPGVPSRTANAELVLSFASRGIRSSVVRLAPTVHGAGDNGFVAALVRFARERGVSGYIGDGLNRWSAVHRLDAAHLFRLALETAPAEATLHGVAEEGLPIRDIAEVIGRHLDLPVRSISPQDAEEHLRLAGRLPRRRQPRLERNHPRSPRLGADPPRPDRRPRSGTLLPAGTRSRCLIEPPSSGPLLRVSRAVRHR